MNGALQPPTIDDLALLWEAIDDADDACGGDWSEVRAAHARVLSYLMDSGVFEQTVAA